MRLTKKRIGRPRSPKTNRRTVRTTDATEVGLEAIAERDGMSVPDLASELLEGAVKAREVRDE